MPGLCQDCARTVPRTLTMLILTMPTLSQQDLEARSVLTRTRPSMEAVRQVPQSSAELQSRVTTGDRCPPSERDACSSRAPPPPSPLVSFMRDIKKEKERKRKFGGWGINLHPFILALLKLQIESSPQVNFSKTFPTFHHHNGMGKEDYFTEEVMTNTVIHSHFG